MYKVHIYGDTRGILPRKTEFHIRHLRNRIRNRKDSKSQTGMVNSTKGGYTIMVNQADSKVYIAKCNESDNFNRRIGILTAIQKYVGNVLISEWNFHDDGVIILIDDTEAARPLWLRKESAE